MFCIAVDFDGTIIGNNFPFDTKVLAGAKETINEYFEKGCHISIWTCREGWFKKDCERILKKNGIKFHDINYGCKSYEHGRKIYADVYIDDKSIPNFNWIKAKYIIGYFYDKKCQISEINEINDKWIFKPDVLFEEFYRACAKRCPDQELFYMKESLEIMLGITERRKDGRNY